MSQSSSWYRSWFNTPYYHILYKDRDDREARFFIQNLVNRLAPSAQSCLLDLACGRGRHARFLNELGHRVTGIDLSESSIEYAQQFTNANLHFEVGDMREPFGEQRFDFIFNLFTSFGYFKNKEDNIAALRCIKKALKPDGTFVFDFMNVHQVQLGLVKEEVRVIEGIEFHITRLIRDEHVIKKISFSDKGQDFEFEESVQLLTLAHFEELFAAAGLCIRSIHGDFELGDFDAVKSDRLILMTGVK